MHCQYQVQVKLKQKSDLHSSVAVLLVSWRTSYGGSFGSGSEQAMSNLRLDCARWCQTAVQLAIGLKSLLSAMHPLAKIWCTMQNVTIHPGHIQFAGSTAMRLDGEQQSEANPSDRQQDTSDMQASDLRPQEGVGRCYYTRLPRLVKVPPLSALLHKHKHKAHSLSENPVGCTVCKLDGCMPDVWRAESWISETMTWYFNIYVAWQEYLLFAGCLPTTRHSCCQVPLHSYCL